MVPRHRRLRGLARRAGDSGRPIATNPSCGSFCSPHRSASSSCSLLSDKAAESEYRDRRHPRRRGLSPGALALADTYDVAARDPDIQVVDVDLLGDRKLIMRHNAATASRLAEGDRDKVMRHVRGCGATTRGWRRRSRSRGPARSPVDAKDGLPNPLKLTLSRLMLRAKRRSICSPAPLAKPQILLVAPEQ